MSGVGRAPFESSSAGSTASSSSTSSISATSASTAAGPRSCGASCSCSARPWPCCPTIPMLDRGRAGRAVPHRLHRPARRAVADRGRGGPGRDGRDARGGGRPRDARGDRPRGRPSGVRVPLPCQPRRHLRAGAGVRRRGGGAGGGRRVRRRARGRGYPHPCRAGATAFEMVDDGRIIAANGVDPAAVAAARTASGCAASGSVPRRSGLAIAAANA